MTKLSTEQREKINSYKRQWAANNREASRKSKDLWRDKNREYGNYLSRKWASENKDRCKDNAKKWRQKNKEICCERSMNFYNKNKEKIAQRMRDRSAERRILYRTKARAKSLGVPFSIDINDIIIPETCPVLGMRLNLEGGRGKGGFLPDAPSIDRVVPLLGYIKGNVRIISWRANSLKLNATPEELRLVAEYSARETARVLGK